MKLLIIGLLSILSLSTFASEIVCEYRFNPRLAVTVTRAMENMHGMRGRIQWDNKNVCTGEAEGEICTEIYPGMFDVRYKDLTPPDTQGAMLFKVRSIARHDDLGNHYRSRSLFGDFIRNARFVSIVIPNPNLSFTWRGRVHQMKCSITSHP